MISRLLLFGRFLVDLVPNVMGSVPVLTGDQLGSVPVPGGGAQSSGDLEETVHLNTHDCPDAHSILVVTSSDPTGVVHDFELLMECRSEDSSNLHGHESSTLEGLPGTRIPKFKPNPVRLTDGARAAKTGLDADEKPVGQSRRLGCTASQWRTGGIPQTKRFVQPRILDSGAEHRALLGRLLLHEKRVAVYLDPECSLNTFPDDAQVQAHRLVNTLNNDVLPFVEGEIHPICDVDLDGCLSILISDLDCRVSKADVPIRGLVRGTDFLDETSYGFGDQLYLDCRLPESDRELRSLLAHEISHAAIYSWQRSEMLDLEIPLRDAQNLVPGWLHEALAHCVELHFEPNSANFTQRLTAFSASPQDAPIMTNDQLVPFQVRRAGARAAATLFIEDVLGRGRPLRSLLNSQQSPVERIERLAGSSFSDVLRTWGIKQAIQCLESSDIPREDEICGDVSIVDRRPFIVPETVQLRNSRREFGHENSTRSEAENAKIRLQRSVRGTASYFLKVDSNVDRISLVADPAAKITVSVVTRMGEEMTVRLLSGQEVDSVAATNREMRTSVPAPAVLSLPKRPTSDRSDLRAEFEATAF